MASIEKRLEDLSVSKEGNPKNDSKNNEDQDEAIKGIKFIPYRNESQIDSVMRLVGRDLSEPYSGMSM